MINSADEFVRLRTSTQTDEYLRAAEEHAPIEVWREVIARFAEMRKWVALNKNVPLEILDLLSRDKDAEVRITVALKRKLSQELFVALANDPDDSVRLAIASNSKVPVEVLKFLTNDGFAEVARVARERLASMSTDEIDAAGDMA